MLISQMRVSHLENPLGFSLEKPVFSFVCQSSGKRLAMARVQIATDEGFACVVHDSGANGVADCVAYVADDFAPASETRYFWRVLARDDAGDEAMSETAFFETGLASFAAKWITTGQSCVRPVTFRKDFCADKRVLSARAYVCGLGVYELYLNGQKVSRECLAPGCHAYDSYLQYQTYDLTGLIAKENSVEALVGAGWYSGRFGFERRKEIYGSEVLLICQIELIFADGTRKTVLSDESWQACLGKITFAGIYDGEWYDDRIEQGEPCPVRLAKAPGAKLSPRLSPPILPHERILPAAILTTPKGETVLDMGQNMVGWLEIFADEPADTELVFQFGEVLDGGNFYNDNLRSAKQEYRFISSGVPCTLRQHFTFYGFRYVKISGLTRKARAEDYTGVVLYSQMDRRGFLTTSDPLINRLYENALWGQKGNFLDVPTDCPQRDERMGWTGDAQAFSGTALYNMDAAAFFRKYLFDMRCEQKKLGGSVPFVVPMVGLDGHGSTGWGEAATVIPWNLYLYTGDLVQLAEAYPGMRMWVDYIGTRCPDNTRLWTVDFHFGDWLALDNFYNPNDCVGGTDIYYLASCYYCYSAHLTAMAAKALCKDEDARKYETLSCEIREAIIREYFTQSGRLSVDTQTAHVVALFMDIALNRERTLNRLRELIAKNGGKLNTGFIGTTYLMRTLSMCGESELAYSILLNREYPGWLCEVLLGATTIWERWNSLKPDGTLGDTGMNSFNHYTYGSVAEWMYGYMLGLSPLASAPGFRRVRFAPMPDKRIPSVSGRIETPVGTYSASYAYADNALRIVLSVPLGAQAEVYLPGEGEAFVADAGTHEFDLALPEER